MKRRLLLLFILVAAILLVLIRVFVFHSFLSRSSNTSAQRLAKKRIEQFHNAALLKKQHDEFNSLYSSTIREHMLLCPQLVSNKHSACPCVRTVADTRLSLIVNDIYAAVDAVFQCTSDGEDDELRPISCSGKNWKSAQDEAEREGEGGSDRWSHHEGIYLSIVDSVSTLILADAAVSRFFSNLHECSTFAHVVGAERFDYNANNDNSNSSHNFAASTPRRALFLIGLSATTIRVMDVILNPDKFERKFLSDTRFLSVFEMNIRFLGAVLSAHDLISALVQSQREDLKRRDEMLLLDLDRVRQRLIRVAQIVADVLLVAFEVRADEPTLADLLLLPASQRGNEGDETKKRVLSTYGLPQPFLRPSAAIKPRQYTAMWFGQRFLSEVGTFDLEFHTLSARLLSSASSSSSSSSAVSDFDARKCSIIASALEQIMFLGQSDHAAPLFSSSDSSSRLRSTMLRPDRGSDGLWRVSWSGHFSAGAMGDSFFEYRVKRMALLLNEKNQNKKDDITWRQLLLKITQDLLVDMKMKMTESFSSSSNKNNHAESKQHRTYVGDLPAASPATLTPSMHHLTCAQGAVFSLYGIIASSLLDKVNDKQTGDREQQQLDLFNSDFWCNELLHDAAIGISRTCADMSRATIEGVAGEVYDFGEAAAAAAGEGATDSKSTRWWSPMYPVQAPPSTEEQRSATVRALEMHLRDADTMFDGVSQPSPLRPEALESLFVTANVMSSVTAHKLCQVNNNQWSDKSDGNKRRTRFAGEDDRIGFVYESVEESWRIFTNLRRISRNPRTGGFTNLLRVRGIAASISKTPLSFRGKLSLPDGERSSSSIFDDVQSSFFLAETLKYSLLMQSMQSEEPSRTDWMPPDEDDLDPEKNDNNNNNSTASVKMNKKNLKPEERELAVILKRHRFVGRNMPWSCFGGDELPVDTGLFAQVACKLGTEYVLNTEAHPLRI